ncbi:MAG: NUDIX hydrolase, partial [Bacillota bacterium]|nr:NUDIX hydrolase [Bacillota bacterium]
MSSFTDNKLKIISVKPTERLKYLHSFEIEYSTKTGRTAKWELASRSGLERLEKEIFKHERFTDGAMIFATNREKTQMVLLKEFRVTAGRYVYTIPAGLIDPDESIEMAAIREFKEETGMDFSPQYVDRSRYVSVGIVNECINIVYGYFSGEPSSEFLTDEEDAQAI